MDRDQIDWLGEWNTPQEVGGGDAQEEEDLKAAYEKGGNGRLFRGVRCRSHSLSLCLSVLSLSLWWLA